MGEAGLMNLMVETDSDSEEDEDLQALRYKDPRQYVNTDDWMADVYDTTEEDLMQLTGLQAVGLVMLEDGDLALKHECDQLQEMSKYCWRNFWDCEAKDKQYQTKWKQLGCKK